MLDSDLAELYEVDVKVLNQSVRRNVIRFPADFMFQLTREEAALLRSQIVTLDEGRRGAHPMRNWPAGSTNSKRGPTAGLVPYSRPFAA
jgi:ORF6N domain